MTQISTQPKQIFQSLGLHQSQKIKISIKTTCKLATWLKSISNTSRPYSFHVLEALRLYEAIYLSLLSNPDWLPVEELNSLKDHAVNVTISKSELKVLRSLSNGRMKNLPYHLRRALIAYRKLYEIISIYDLYRITQIKGREAVYQILVQAGVDLY